VGVAGSQLAPDPVGRSDGDSCEELHGPANQAPHLAVT
jgi:hypothetical protein